MGVLRPLASRLGIFALSLLAASFVVFALLNLLPGDVASVILGSGATPEAVARLREELGLDRSFWIRYFEWLIGLFHGDFGSSAFTGEPVAPLIAAKLSVTLSLVGLGMGLAVLIALPVGIFAAQNRRRVSGQLVSVSAQLGMSIPAFLAGLILVIVFAVTLRWLPPSGYEPLTSDPGEWLRRLILPAFALGLVQSAVLVRYVRGAFIEVLGEDYYRTARAVGWRKKQALTRHGMRNAAIGLTTVLGLQLSTLFVGAIVIEKVFVLPGLGSLLLSAVSTRNLPVVQGIVMLLVALILVINAIVDALYLLIDPRLRAGQR